MSIQTIFFDWGGVIADDPGDEFLGKLLLDSGASEAQVDEIHDSYMRTFMRGEISEAEYWQLLRDNYGLNIHESISESFKEWRGLVVNNDILQLNQVAKDQGIKTALITNIIEPTYNALADTNHFAAFDAVIASCKVGFAKPQVEIYELALQQMDATSESSLFIDDKQRNLDPAIRMGFKTILATGPAQIIEDVTAYLGR